MAATSQDIFQFRATFPELGTVKDGDIAGLLNTADVYLDASQWSTRDFATARLYWAAHMLSLQQQQLANVTIDGTGMSDLFVRSIHIGERSVNFAQRKLFDTASAGSGPGELQLNLTSYGLFFLQLRTRNIMPIMIV